MNNRKTRVENDSMGPMTVPFDAYHGASTARSLANFQISPLRLFPEQIHAMVALKLACAKANMELGLLPKRKGDAIIRACREVRAGRFDAEFGLDVFQSGSGTSTNMNVNEVVANRASELLGGRRGSKRVHPNDDVNMGQSTNNIFPSSIRVAATPLLLTLIKAAENFSKTLAQKGKEFDRVIKSGRTHLQDAVPIRMGQVFNAFSRSIRKDAERLRLKIRHVSELGAGGNAVGTGINTHPSFRKRIIKNLNAELGSKMFRVAPDGVEATHSTNDLADLSGAVQTLAVDVARICNDIRLMASGPLTGLNELRLPPVEPGSSIMPGKINPSICEAVNMACLRVFGNHHTVTLSAMSAQLELNVTMPVTAYALLESLKIMASAVATLDEKCVAGLEANKEQCMAYAMASPSLATFLNPVIGYEKSASIVKKALAEKKTIPQVVLEQGILTKEELRIIFDPARLTSPEIYKKGKIDR
ncbi:MAG: aspartate ammonia-lyase [Nitrospinae bacterium]|nr:aspartate ammonia-lyase [Nitrospinota bacterium]